MCNRSVGGNPKNKRKIKRGCHNAFKTFTTGRPNVDSDVFIHSGVFCWLLCQRGVISAVCVFEGEGIRMGKLIKLVLEWWDEHSDECGLDKGPAQR